jgi:hypothetical protein
MSDELILSFPILKQNGGDFLDSIVYTVDAIQHQNDRKLIITHTLKGESFITKLVKNKKASFLVTLFYKDNAERQKFICNNWEYDEEAQEIVAEQNIDIDFSYAPEIMPCIVVMNDEKIAVDGQSGLTDFWQSEVFDIPALSRVAYHLKLQFTSGDVSSLINVQCEEDYQSGSIKTKVTETAGEGEQPIKIICAQDVYDELNKQVTDSPFDALTAMRKAIITQVLCHVYAYMNNLENKEDIHSGLLKHMEVVLDKTGENWEDDSNFNASFAATKITPYAIDALNKENK